MIISVIIPTFNEELSIRKTLDAPSRLVNVDEVIIVDGGSADKTVAIIEGYDPPQGWFWCYVDEVFFEIPGRETPQDGPIPRYDGRP